MGGGNVYFGIFAQIFKFSIDKKKLKKCECMKIGSQVIGKMSMILVKLHHWSLYFDKSFILVAIVLIYTSKTL